MIVAGVGTGGTITGVAEVIKKRKPGFKAIAVEPAATRRDSPDPQRRTRSSPAATRSRASAPASSPRTFDTDIVDEVVGVTNEEAFEWARRLQQEEGIFGGISSGANISAAAKVAARPENKGKMIVVVLPSIGERYLSTPLFEEE